MFKKIMILAMSFAFFLPCAAEKKIIELSWSNPTVDFLAANLKKMEKDSPLDGITIRVFGKPRRAGGKYIVPGRGDIFRNVPWKYSDFNEAVAKLKKLEFTRFKHNFFYITTSYADLDWFNDADVRIVANNFAIAAKIAKETGMKGFLLDIEEYGKKIFQYKANKLKQGLAETRIRVRQSGRQIGKAIFKEFPDIVIFMPFMFNYHHFSGIGANKVLSADFINGILDVIPPGARMVEGMEAISYAAKKPSDYDYIRRHFRDIESKFAAPENLGKFRRQVQLAPAFYMDPICLKKSGGKKYLKPEIDAGSLPFLRRNLTAALAVSDEYVWLYSEKGGFWDHNYHRQYTGTWEKHCPTINQVIKGAKNYDLIPYNEKENLLKNGRFQIAKQSWGFWQIENDQKKPAPGKGTVGGGICSIKGVTNGCFTQNVRVKGGDLLIFRVRYKYTSGNAGIRIACRDTKGKWLRFHWHQRIPLAYSKDFTYASMLFQVPENVASLSVQLGADSQGKNGEIIFSEAFLLKP